MRMDTLKRLTPPIMSELFMQISFHPELYSVPLGQDSQVENLPEEAEIAWGTVMEPIMQQFPRVTSGVAFRSWRNMRRNYGTSQLPKKWVEHLEFLSTVKGTLKFHTRKDDRSANVVYRLFGEKPFNHFQILLQDCEALANTSPDTAIKFTMLKYRARDEVDGLVLKMKRKFPRVCDKINENLVLAGWKEIRQSGRSPTAAAAPSTPLACLKLVKRSTKVCRAEKRRSASRSPTRVAVYRDHSAPGGRGRVVLAFAMRNTTESPPKLHAIRSPSVRSTAEIDSPPSLVQEGSPVSRELRRKLTEHEQAAQASEFFAQKFKNYPALSEVDPNTLQSPAELPEEGKKAWKLLLADITKLSPTITEETTFKAWRSAENIAAVIEKSEPPRRTAVAVRKGPKNLASKAAVEKPTVETRAPLRPILPKPGSSKASPTKDHSIDKILFRAKTLTLPTVPAKPPQEPKRNRKRVWPTQVQVEEAKKANLISTPPEPIAVPAAAIPIVKPPPPIVAPQPFHPFIHGRNPLSIDFSQARELAAYAVERQLIIQRLMQFFIPGAPSYN